MSLMGLKEARHGFSSLYIVAKVTYAKKKRRSEKERERERDRKESHVIHTRVARARGTEWLAGNCSITVSAPLYISYRD